MTAALNRSHRTADRKIPQGTYGTTTLHSTEPSNVVCIVDFSHNQNSEKVRAWVNRNKMMIRPLMKKSQVILLASGTSKNHLTRSLRMSGVSVSHSRGPGLYISTHAESHEMLAKLLSTERANRLFWYIDSSDVELAHYSFNDHLIRSMLGSMTCIGKRRGAVSKEIHELIDQYDNPAMNDAPCVLSKSEVARLRCSNQSAFPIHSSNTVFKEWAFLDILESSVAQRVRLAELPQLIVPFLKYGVCIEA